MCGFTDSSPDRWKILTDDVTQVSYLRFSQKSENSNYCYEEKKEVGGEVVCSGSLWVFSIRFPYPNALSKPL